MTPVEFLARIKARKPVWGPSFNSYWVELTIYEARVLHSFLGEGPPAHIDGKCLYAVPQLTNCLFARQKYVDTTERVQAAMALAVADALVNSHG